MVFGGVKFAYPKRYTFWDKPVRKKFKEDISMLKRTISLAFVATVIFLCCIFSVNTITFADAYEDYEYTVTGGGATITKYNGTAGNLTIPSMLNGVAVTAIGDSAFYNCKALHAVVLPDSLKTIGSFAFRECAGLQSVTLKEGLTTIGQGAFYGCSSLETLSIPNSVTTINSRDNIVYYGTFRDCISLTNVTIGNGLTQIQDGTFDGCISLETVTISSGTVAIGDYAFYGCARLGKIAIPESVRTIASNAFTGHSPSLTIYGKIGSYAQTYAINNSILFASAITIADPAEFEFAVTGIQYKVKNNGDAQSGQVIIAIYNTSGILVHVKYAENVTINSGETVGSFTGLNIPSELRNQYVVKLFLWTSVGNVIPLTLEPAMLNF
jgi:hypothetical protein